MIELPLIFVGGVLGSSHCIGMCGPFAVAVGTGANGWRNNLARQSVYSAGRIFTYTVGGALAGYFGMRVTRELPEIVPWQALLAVVAGVLLVLQGISAAGLLRRPVRASAGGPCLASSFFAPLLTAPGMRHAFLAGMLTGMLPCGLVYAFLALAAASGNMLGGMLTMAAFGLGTVPIMVLTGSGAMVLKLAARRQLFRLAALCVVVTGVVTIARGVGFLDLPPTAALEHSTMHGH